MEYPDDVARKKQIERILDRIEQLPILPGISADLQLTSGINRLPTPAVTQSSSQHWSQRDRVTPVARKIGTARPNGIALGSSLFALVIALNAVVAVGLAVVITLNVVGSRQPREQNPLGSSGMLSAVNSVGKPTVEATPTNLVEAVLDGETVLAAFDLSAADDIEEEVARVHGLELAERTALLSRGLRIARYHVPDDLSVAIVVGRLQSDPRIKGARVIALHQPLEPASLTTELNTAQEFPQIGSQDGKRSAPTTALGHEPTRKPAAARAPLKPVARVPAGEQQLPARVGRVGDVLAGGL